MPNRRVNTHHESLWHFSSHGTSCLWRRTLKTLNDCNALFISTWTLYLPLRRCPQPNQGYYFAFNNEMLSIYFYNLLWLMPCVISMWVLKLWTLERMYIHINLIQSALVHVGFDFLLLLNWTELSWSCSLHSLWTSKCIPGIEVAATELVF